MRLRREHENCRGGKSLTRLSLTRRYRFDAVHHRSVAVSFNLRLCRHNRHETALRAATKSHEKMLCGRRKEHMPQTRNGSSSRHEITRNVVRKTEGRIRLLRRCRRACATRPGIGVKPSFWLRSKSRYKSSSQRRSKNDSYT